MTVKAEIRPHASDGSTQKPHETEMPNRFYARSIHLCALLDNNPVDAIKQSRKIDLDMPDRFNLISLRAAILVDGGVLIHNQDAIEEGLALFRELHGLFPDAGITYKLADGLVAAIGQSASASRTH